jgi:multidrug efflux system outer membrane protein
MPSHIAKISLIGVASSLVLLTGCSVGPDYVKPTVEQPIDYKEAGKWKKAEPRDDISKGNWYTVFHDKELNDLEAKAVTANQNLRAAIARVSESRAIARETEAGFFPTVNFEASGTRNTSSPYDGQTMAQLGGVGPRTFYTSATVVPFDLSYEVDIWGKVRRSFEEAGDKAQANIADYENVLLGLKADVATTYFAIRTDDAEIDVQRHTIKEYQSALDLTNSRFKGGISTDLDVQQATATLAAAQAQLAALDNGRTKLEHALAVLLGEPPESLTIPYRPLDSSYSPPNIPPGVPSDVLERRPDVAAAERRVAAQNAAIGVAIAAYFPVVNLTGQTGFDSGDLSMLLNWQSRIWSYGPTIQFPIFEGGQITANVKQQRAAYEENVADYRQQVLVAFQDVDDSLSSLRYLAQQQEAQDRAYAAYNKALQLTNDRYTTGLVSYFDVIQAENLALAAEQLTVQIRGDRVANTIQLIKALGGGWADSYITQPEHGDHVASPNVQPTVLKPVQPTNPPVPANVK